MSDTKETRDYKDTVFLPKTDFPMKAGLPQKEPGILAHWESQGLYSQLREARAGREKFILHDGPPYANGDIHIGHALNHVLKDMVCRTQSLLGKDAPYVPGWDCHGLPIEWKVEEQYRKKKKNKDEVPPKEFRAECRAYAQKWVDVQREQIKRLGILGRWDKPYLTMDFDSEATIVSELMKFAESGQLYRGAKPVMWSPVEKTALAEAEVEYEWLNDTTQIDVAFEITASPIKELIGAHAVIWTTTPWTIPVNQALAYGPEIEYAIIRRKDGRRFLVGTGDADVLLYNFLQRHSKYLSDPEASEYITESKFKGSELAGTVARHPMHHLGGFYAEPRPFLPGDFVTTDSGTGLVHMAPDHGEDDFDLCKAHGLNPKFVVEADGRYREDWAWLPRTDERSMSVIHPKFNAPDGPVCSDLRDAQALLSASADYSHSYPHSWRSKAKVIFRCTPQWFIPMDKPMGAFDYPVAPLGGIGGAVAMNVDAAHTATLRETAMNAIDKTRFVPEKGKNRIGAMVKDRPDWVISRQRAWGVPIALFVDRKTGEYLVDADVNARIVAAIREVGVDAWEEARAAEFLGEGRNPDDYEMVRDILDVWFDSGTTHAFVVSSGKWPEITPEPGHTGPVADMYLEGSDQHRGWFQSSLLESCGTRGHAPYKQVLTHGFTMDSKGMKMSKSVGNTVDPLKVMQEYGADIIRLWALSVDFTEDHRIGPEILKGVADQYRKLRNTFRYLLGALNDYDPREAVAVADMPELERYVLGLLADLDGKLRQAVEDYDYNACVRLLSDFANEDLSAFYFDIRKDCLYCDVNPESGWQSQKRAACRTVMDTLFQVLIRYAAPVLVFTAEEVWGTRYPEGGSVHLLEWPILPDKLESDQFPKNSQYSGLKGKWDKARLYRTAISRAIEPHRREKEIKSSLEANVELSLSCLADREFLEQMDLAELAICARVTILNEATLEGDVLFGHDAVSDLVSRVRVTPSEEPKCERCWRHLPVDPETALCGRCSEALAS